VFAIKAYRSSERAGTKADRRFALEVEPRVQVQFPVKRSFEDGSVTATISNAGGAAKAYVLLLNYPDGLHQSRGSLPEHASVQAHFQHISIQLSGLPYQSAVVTLAQDIEGRWWDCLAHSEVTNWQAWIAAHQELVDGGALEYADLPLLP
jgi:hypothetical protein